MKSPFKFLDSILNPKYSSQKKQYNFAFILHYCTTFIEKTLWFREISII